MTRPTAQILDTCWSGSKGSHRIYLWPNRRSGPGSRATGHCGWGALAPRSVESAPRCSRSASQTSFRLNAWLRWANTIDTKWLHGENVRACLSTPCFLASLDTKYAGIFDSTCVNMLYLSLAGFIRLPLFKRCERLLNKYIFGGPALYHLP